MRPCAHNVRIEGRPTSVWLEPSFWDQFRLIALEHGTTIGKMLAEVDRTQRLLPYQGPGNPRVLGLSAAVRVFVLQDLMRKLAIAEQRANQRRRGGRRSYPRDPRQASEG
jgi:predicted DNA-binding ribbon-helix-helix protein